MTVIIGVLSWGLMPPGPTQTQNWFRGANGWFDEHEEKILVNRLLRDDPSKGDMNNRQGVGLKLLWKAIQDWEMWPLYIVGLLACKSIPLISASSKELSVACDKTGGDVFDYTRGELLLTCISQHTDIPPSPPQNYLSYILRQLGFSVFEANLLVIPSQVLFACQLLFITWVSRRFQERSVVSSASNIWILPCLVALVLLPAGATWSRYAVLTVLLSYPYCHAILVAWNAANSNAVRTRAVSAALYNMFVQSGNIIASNIYREDDSPLYRRGNKILIGITSFNIVLFYLVKAFYLWRNRVRDRKWSAMTPEEREDYLLHTTDEGQQRLDFRFVH